MGFLAFYLLLTCGCANSRRIMVESRDLDLASASHFHITLNRRTEKVVYDPAAIFLSYDEYAKGRKRASFKPDVPDAIAHFLIAKRKSVTFGEDRGITAYRRDNPALSAQAGFSEMTGFNSHPTAGRLVPKMMDSLFISK